MRGGNVGKLLSYSWAKKLSAFMQLNPIDFINVAFSFPGGLLSLYIGFSFLTMIEILFWMLRFGFNICKGEET